MAVEPAKDAWGDLAGFDFEALLKDGLELIQQLCGRSWTDHNLHDPGITVLEALCYALSEMAYFCSFPMRDHLTGADSTIDLAGLALFRPEAVLPSRPVTASDIGKLLFAGLADVEDVRVESMSWDSGIRGLYRIGLRVGASLDSRASSDGTESLHVRASRLFHSNRNLCEDAGEIALLPSRPCRLRGTVLLDGSRSAIDLHAEIHFRCARRIASNLRFERLESVIARGAAPDEIFTGPYLEPGVLDDTDFEAALRMPELSDLVAEIESIPGVLQAESLHLVDENGDDADGYLSEPSAAAGLPVLSFPADPTQASRLALRLSDGTETAVDAAFLQGSRMRCRKLEFEHRAFRTDRSRPELLLPVPAGRHRDLSSYHSIQKDFPAIYGINAAGVPASAALEIRSRANQLKGYLLPFDQLLANLQETIGQATHLLSLDTGLELCRFAPVLGNDTVPAAGTLYAKKNLRKELDGILLRTEDPALRRIALLDHMLAVHGEEFPEWPDCLSGRSEDSRRAIGNRIAFLRELPVLSVHRMGAEDLSRPDHRSPWLRRIGLLLGLHDGGGASATRQLVSRGIEPATPGSAQLLAPGSALLAVGKLAEPAPALRLHNCTLSLDVLRHGHRIRCYSIHPEASGASLCFQEAPDRPPQRLAGFPSVDAARRGAHRFAAGVEELSLACEAIHLVEHVLLRPRAGRPQDLDGFHSHRLSVVLPDWTRWGADAAFRRMATDTIGQELSAHLVADVLWLDIDSMRRFESLQEGWRTGLTDWMHGKLPVGHLDDLAAELRELLQAFRAQAVERATP